MFKRQISAHRSDIAELPLHVCIYRSGDKRAHLGTGIRSYRPSVSDLRLLRNNRTNDR